MEIIIKGNADGPKLAVRKKGIAIIVDVLRASTTIPVTMNSTNKEAIYVIKEVEDTYQFQKEFDAILMGERGCKKLAGYEYGNSPTEMSGLDSISDKKLGFTSSTGARRVSESIGAKYQLIGSIINAEAVAKTAKKIAEEEDLAIIIIPAFTKGKITTNEITEDQIGAVIIARELLKIGCDLDSKIIAEVTHLEELLKKKTLYDILLETAHGKKLLTLGFKSDISFCARESEIVIVPLSKNDNIELKSGVKIVKLEKNEG